MKEIIKNAPYVADSFFNLTTAITDYGTKYKIDSKVKELILVAAFTVTGGYTGVVTHTKRALEAGCTKEEVIAAILYTIPVCGISKVNLAMERVSNI